MTMRHTIKEISIIFIVCLWCAVLPTSASAIDQEEDNSATQDKVESTLIQEFDFQDINNSLKDIFPGEKIDFKETVQGLIKGDIKFTTALIGRLVKEKIFYEFNYHKESLVHILLIAIIAAVFTNFSSVFQNKQVSEISFYILYLLLITICLSSFQMLIASVEQNLTMLVSFMQVLSPAYFLGVAFASGSASSVAFYNIVLLLIYLVELLILNFLLPLVHILIMVKILNHLSEEDYLSKFAELLETVIAWTLKTLLACVIGLNVIQGLLSPAIDSLKRSALTRGAEAIPGVGDAIGGVAQVVLGTAVLIKNGIGMAGAIICIIICLAPIIQMAVMTLLYKLTAAMIQPISDKRLVNCVGSMGEGCQLLLRVVFTAGVLFLITIAVVTAATT